MDIPGYRFVRSDHPSNDKQSGVGVNFKSVLPIQILNIFMLNECIILDMTSYGKLCKITWFLSQNLKKFETFVKIVELDDEFIFNKNQYLTVVIGDFNAKSHNWYKGGKTAASGSKLEVMTSHYGIIQIVNEPTHILEDS